MPMRDAATAHDQRLVCHGAQYIGCRKWAPLRTNVMLVEFFWVEHAKGKTDCGENIADTASAEVMDQDAALIECTD